jgi:hypothetical protein
MTETEFYAGVGKVFLSFVLPIIVVLGVAVAMISFMSLSVRVAELEKQASKSTESK